MPKAIIKTKPQFGFTLVELLVVIVILAILVTVGMVVFKNVGKKARTAKRIADLKELQQVLERYKIENGTYPQTGSSQASLEWRSECFQSPPNQVIPGLVPNYLHSMPSDPAMFKIDDGTANGDLSCYWYISDGIGYKFEIWNINEFTQADYRAYPQFVDPAFDGGPNPGGGNGIYVPAEFDPTSCDGTGDNTGIVEAWSIQTRGFRCVQ